MEIYIFSLALKIKADVEAMEHSTQDGTPVSTEAESGGSRNVGNQSSSVNAEDPQAQIHYPTPQQVMCRIATLYMDAIPPQVQEDFDHFANFIERIGVRLESVTTGSLLITVKCDSLQILEKLWEEYLSGHLGEVIQRSFVTDEILKEFSLAELKLKTTISKEEYKACKAYFEKDLSEG